MNWAAAAIERQLSWLDGRRVCHNARMLRDFDKNSYVTWRMTSPTNQIHIQS